MNNDQIQSALNWRYATKKYDPARKISDADWKTLEASLVLAPSSYGLQPFKFLVIETPALRSQLRDAAYGQTQVTDAAKLVVLVAREQVESKDIDAYINRIAATRGLPKESLKGFQDTMNGAITSQSPSDSGAWARRQAYIALGFLVETAALLKIDATPMEGFDAAAFDKILGLAGTGFKTAVVAALGYRHAEDSTQSYKKVRQETKEILQYR
jgi:nitroreductase